MTPFSDIYVKNSNLFLFPIGFDLNLTENIHFC